MDSRFLRLFSLQIFHTYFKDGICNCFSFGPDADTARLIKRFGFQLRQNVGGFGFYSTKPDAVNYLNYIESVTDKSCFVFEMTCNNALFEGFTAAPSRGKWQYTTAQTASEEGKLKLLPIVQTGNGVSGTVVIRFVDLIGLMQQANSCDFEIRYEAKTTQWQYYIINKSQLALQNPMVSGKSGIPFSDAVAVNIPTGESALLFSSVEPIALSESPQSVFDLVNAHKSSPGKVGKPIIRGLPNPDPARSGMAEIAGKKIETSPMYVYI